MPSNNFRRSSNATSNLRPLNRPARRLSEVIQRYKDSLGSSSVDDHGNTQPSTKASLKAEPQEEEDEEDQEEFEIDQIVSHRFHQNRVQYRVRWAGYSPDEDTWEPHLNVRDTEPFHNYLLSLDPHTRPKPDDEPDDNDDEPDDNDDEQNELQSESDLTSIDSVNDETGPTQPPTPPAPTPQPPPDRRKRVRSTTSVSDVVTEALLEDLKQHLEPTEDPSTACRTIVGANHDACLIEMKEAAVVIWAPQDNFETLALWFCIVEAGGHRVRYGQPNRGLKSVVEVESVGPKKVNALFIHRSRLSEFLNLKGLVELIKQPNYVKVYAFGKAADESSHPLEPIRPILTLNSVLMPTYKSITRDLTPTMNPFELLRALQRDQLACQIFLHPITARLLARKYLQNPIPAIANLLGELAPVPIPMERHELSEARFGLLARKGEEGDEWTETDEVEAIVEALEDIRLLSYDHIRRLVIVVEEQSTWLNSIDAENVKRVASVEVMSMGQAMARLANDVGPLLSN